LIIHHLLMSQVEFFIQPAAEDCKIILRPVTGIGEGNIKDQLDAAGTWRQQDHLLRNLDCLIQIIGHQDDRWSLLLPNVQQLVLQVQA